MFYVYRNVITTRILVHERLKYIVVNLSLITSPLSNLTSAKMVRPRRRKKSNYDVIIREHAISDRFAGRYSEIVRLREQMVMRIDRCCAMPRLRKRQMASGQWSNEHRCSGRYDDTH